MGSGMKVHQFSRGLWEHEPSLTLGCCKNTSLLLRPLAPKLPTADSVTTTAATATAAFDLKSFIRPESGPRKLGSSDHKTEATQVILRNYVWMSSRVHEKFFLKKSRPFISLSYIFFFRENLFCILTFLLCLLLPCKIEKRVAWKYDICFFLVFFL